MGDPRGFRRATPTPRAARVLLGAAAVTHVGDEATAVALALALYASGASGVTIAALFVVKILPVVLLAPVAGWVTDRYRPDLLLTGASAVAGLVVASTASTTSTPLWLVGTASLPPVRWPRPLCGGGALLAGLAGVVALRPGLSGARPSRHLLSSCLHPARRPTPLPRQHPSWPARREGPTAPSGAADPIGRLCARVVRRPLGEAGRTGLLDRHGGPPLTWPTPPPTADAARSRRPGTRVAALLAAVACTAVAAPATALTLRPTAPVPTTSVVVRAVPGELAAATSAVSAVGGKVTGTLPLIDGLVVRVPVSALPVLRRDGDIAAVTPDRRLTLPAPDPVVEPLVAVVTGTVGTAADALAYDPVQDAGAVPHVGRTVRADAAYRAGITGRGVTVAVIDTGVSDVPGLQTGNVVDGPDLSLDGETPALAHQDGYGHGSHMSGIIAGRDHTETDPTKYAAPTGFTGIAPDARILDVKVGASDGAVDVSQIIAAIGWVVDNKESEGIGVLNLSFGTESVQDYRTDPLAYAAGKAWDAGIVVVAAAGNDGDDVKTLTNPATHPDVIAVGASDSVGTVDRADDTLASFANRGTGKRHADLVAPGVGITSLRVPGGALDSAHPAARRGTRFFRGSGTSQSTAVVSGAAALVRQQHPDYTPDQVKAVLTRSAWAGLPGSTVAKGAGQLDVAAAVALPAVSAKEAEQHHAPAAGGGSLEGSRGGLHVTIGGQQLAGEKDVTGAPWSGSTWRGTSWNGSTWRGDTWSGSTWRGSTWRGETWSGSTWRGTSWSGSTWRGTSWSGTRWN